MEINGFISEFADLFINTPISEFTPDTNFWELEEWSSIVALSVVAMVEECFNVTLNAKDVKSAKTIEELFAIVQGKIKQ